MCIIKSVQINHFVSERAFASLATKLRQYPLFLPHKAHLTTLIVRMAHHHVMHNGVKETDRSAKELLDSQES